LGMHEFLVLEIVAVRLDVKYVSKSISHLHDESDGGWHPVAARGDATGQRAAIYVPHPLPLKFKIICML